MKKFAKVMAIAAACAALTGSVAAFSACGEGGESYQIDISGSTSMEDAMTALADKFIEMKGEEGIELTINISATGSGSGISDAEQGKVDFGMASRALEGDETEQLESKTICLDGISVVVNPKCTLKSVTKSQLVNLYTKGEAIGDVTAALRRESGSGTRDGFEEALGIKGETMFDDAAGFDEFTSTGTLKASIVADTAGKKLGYISMGSVDSSVKTLAYDAEDGKGAVPATKENVLNGSYAISRPFVICYQSYDELSDITKEFIEFIMSDAGQQICEDEGCISEVLANK